MTKNVTGFDFEIGSNLVKARKIKNMTRKELAGKLKITHQQLQKYENGINRISASRLMEVANILKTDILYFYGVNKASNSLREDGIDFDSGQVNEIALLISRIKNKKKLDAVKNLITSLISEEI